MSERTGEKSGLIEKVIKVNRVAKVVKGGRRFSFNALVVVGDGNGSVGYGLGKANEVAEAVRKGIDRATKNMKKVVIEGRTVPHQVIGRFGASRVVINPAQPGRGIVAAGPVRAVMECAGIHDIAVKRLGSGNPHNMIKATLEGMFRIKSMEEIAFRRGVPLERLRQARSG